MGSDELQINGMMWVGGWSGTEFVSVGVIIGYTAFITLLRFKGSALLAFR